MFTWLKMLTLKSAIRELDQLERPFADLIRKGQKNADKIDPEMFAKEMVDMVQTKACKIAKLDPLEVLK